MTTVFRPTEQIEGLKVLRGDNIFATRFKAEAAFDRITTLAARLFDVPIALVAVVDDFRHWFKFSDRFETDENSWNETISSFTVLTNDVLIIPDTKDNSCFVSQPFTPNEPNIRFYASAPLITRDGFNLGNFCLVDSKPHQDLNAEQRATLIDLAAIVVDELERKHALSEYAQLLASEQAARAKAEAANANKNEFIFTLAHELRTPLSAILGWSRLLIERKLDKPTATRGLETIARSAKMQSQLIEDLLDVTRIEQGKIRLNFYPVKLAPLIAAAIDAMQPAADAKNIQLEVMLAPYSGIVSADPDRLQQVIWNLLSNSIKFTPVGGRVEIRLASFQSSVQFQVSDTGKGIDPELLSYIFERFRQAEETSNKTQTGLGLGLAIASHLIKLHGGTIWAESLGEGQGATFTVRLPLMNVPLEANNINNNERYDEGDRPD